MRSSDRDDRRHDLRGWPLRLAAVVFAAMVATVPAHAQDLGVIGPVYPIAEPNLLEVILGTTSRGRRGRHARPSAARVAGTGSGETSKTQRRWRALAHPSTAALPPRPEHRRAGGHPRRGARHRAASTVVNPLDTVTRQTLLFIDARDREQVARARKLIDERQGKVKVILTGGPTWT